MVKYGVLIGINYKNTKDQLDGCINDVSNVRTFLETQLGYTEFVMLTDDTPLKPTRINILNAINSLVRKIKPGDEAWFHYSGHGILVTDRNGDEDSGFDTCITPIDYNNRRSGGGLISDDTLRSNLVQKIPSGAKLYVVLDACHSGTGCDLRYKYDDSSYVGNRDAAPLTYVPSEWSLRQTSYEFKRYSKTAGEVYCISGCQDDQESADAFIESDKMYGGALTSTMLSLFKSNDLRVYVWKHLLKDITCYLKVNGYNQVPAITSGRPLDVESAIFSFSVRNPSKPSKPSSSSKHKYIHTMNSIAKTVNKMNNNQMKKMIFA
jgi:hypothetical protein